MKDDKKEVEKGIPFSEKLQFNCMECCENCQVFECPNNLTRCQ